MKYEEGLGAQVEKLNAMYTRVLTIRQMGTLSRSVHSTAIIGATPTDLPGQDGMGFTTSLRRTK